MAAEFPPDVPDRNDAEQTRTMTVELKLPERAHDVRDSLRHTGGRHLPGCAAGAD